MDLSVLVPLVLSVVFLTPLVLIQVYPPVDRVFTRLSLYLFGSMMEKSQLRETRKEVLRSARFSARYQLYASKTVGYAALVAMAATVVGVSLVRAAGTLLASVLPTFVERLPESLQFLSGLLLPDLEPAQVFMLLVASSATFGVLSGSTVYFYRWWHPRYVADNLRRQIDRGLIYTTALMYALSMGGVPFPKIMRTLAENRAVYGEISEEFDIAVRDMEQIGSDVLTAINRLATRTPSRRLSRFARNLVIVLEGGKQLPEFLRDQYEHFYDEVEDQQELFLEIIAALAEGYVGLLVAAPLFLITILVLIGMVLDQTLTIIRILVYFGIPAATLAFMIFLEGITSALRVARRRAHVREELRIRDVPESPEEHYDEANMERVRLFNRYEVLFKYVWRPWRLLGEKPTALLYITTPAAVVFILVQTYRGFSAGTLNVAYMDDVVIQAVLFVLATFGVLREIHRRRIYSVESVISAFLDQLASINEAGRTIAKGIEKISRTELGPLGPEIVRAGRDIRWNGNAKNTVRRMETRVRTEGFTRATVLITHAMTATGDLGQVLRIAADDAESHFHLKKKRRETTFTYLLVIYISFFVFLGIVAALHMVFIPNVPVAEEGITRAVGAGIAGGYSVTEATKQAYILVLFHSALVQAVCSGLVAGQLGEGSVKDGAKHAVLMLVFAYAMFLALV